MIISDLCSRLLRAAYGLRNVGVSVICVYNDYEKLNRLLCTSLKRQTCPFELLTVDNRLGQHPSAGKILNTIARKARFPYLMFAHQDVSLTSPRWLRTSLNVLSRLDNCGAVGAAGKTPSGIVASIFHGSPPVFAGGKRVESPTQVQTLDGCLLCVPKAVFEKIHFDESHNGWYLYVANYCLDLGRYGYKSYVLPGAVYHESTGPADSSAYESARKHLLRRHRAFVPMVYTTVGDWKTAF